MYSEPNEVFNTSRNEQIMTMPHGDVDLERIAFSFPELHASMMRDIKRWKEEEADKAFRENLKPHQIGE